ncbi:hypothetical protein [Demequina mangrovi]|uniref:Transcriptional regulator, AbiEi antitoxin, Type IV TA system n=1 Tax=Demequina mangrovi TaxID=1043493 RepID=A0A1H6UG12_9MICO|nr:hypothetical protein [Demequina mangrovi]SEI87065.1 hypothetical protein SAMN05421637_0252 [Demequina mangrovi]
MILVHPDTTGPLAYVRLVRDGTVAAVTREAARPTDVPDSPGLRALGAAPRVPAHTVLTGTAALWVHGWRDAPPSTWHAVGARGLYRPPGCLVELHSGATARSGARIGPVRIAPPPRACLDALRWEDPGHALASVLSGLVTGRIAPAELAHAFGEESPAGTGYSRLRSLLAAVTDASRR